MNETEIKITDKDMLQKAGKLAVAARSVIDCSSLEEVSVRVALMRKALDEYGSLVMEATKQRDAEYSNIGALLA